jgi:hypothetical protein
MPHPCLKKQKPISKDNKFNSNLIKNLDKLKFALHENLRPSVLAILDWQISKQKNFCILIKLLSNYL